MKKKPSIKPTDQDLKDWNSFINNITNIEDKDAPYDNILDSNQCQNLFDIRKDLHGFKMHEALDNGKGYQKQFFMQLTILIIIFQKM